MDLLQGMSNVEIGTASQQACDIFHLLEKSNQCCRKSTWYRVPGGGEIDPGVKRTLELKGYSVIDQSKYDLTWTREGPVRGTVLHRRYWIGVPGGTGRVLLIEAKH